MFELNKWRWRWRKVHLSNTVDKKFGTYSERPALTKWSQIREKTTLPHCRLEVLKTSRHGTVDEATVLSDV